MFAPATSMSHVDMHGAPHGAQTEATSAARPAPPHSGPAYVTGELSGEFFSTGGGGREAI